MKRQNERKHISRWGSISIVNQGSEPITFNLDEHGKLTKKIRRQAPRDLSEELKKIPMKDAANGQFLTIKPQVCTNISYKAPSSQSLILCDQNTNLLDQSANFDQALSTTDPCSGFPISQDDSCQFDLSFVSDIFSSDYGGLDCSDEIRFDVDDSNLLNPIGFQF